MVNPNKNLCPPKVPDAAEPNVPVPEGQIVPNPEEPVVPDAVEPEPSRVAVDEYLIHTEAIEYLERELETVFDEPAVFVGINRVIAQFKDGQIDKDDILLELSPYFQHHLFLKHGFLNRFPLCMRQVLLDRAGGLNPPNLLQVSAVDENEPSELIALAQLLFPRPPPTGEYAVLVKPVEGRLTQVDFVEPQPVGGANKIFDEPLPHRGLYVILVIPPEPDVPYVNFQPPLPPIGGAGFQADPYRGAMIRQIIPLIDNNEGIYQPLEEEVQHAQPFEDEVLYAQVQYQPQQYEGAQVQYQPQQYEGAQAYPQPLNQPAINAPRESSSETSEESSESSESSESDEKLLAAGGNLNERAKSKKPGSKKPESKKSESKKSESKKSDSEKSESESSQDTRGEDSPMSTGSD